MKYHCLLYFVLFQSCISSNEYFVVKYSSGASLKKIVKFNVGPNTNENHIFWDQEKAGISCTFGPWANRAQASIECTGPNDFKTQTIVNCDVNNSEKNASYLYFGKTWIKRGHINVYSWCE